MTSATYHSKVPSDLTPCCEAMGLLFGEVERHLYKALERGEKLNNLKKEYQIRYGNGVLGVDLNPGVIGWAICDQQGNLKDKGQICLNLNNRSTEQIEATLGDAVKQLVEIASRCSSPIAVEHLDFSKKKTQMKEQGVRYSRMLSNFSYAKFLELLGSRTQRFGIELIV